MFFITTVYEALRTHYYFFQWQDALEILFFSTLFYHLTRWLKKDRHKNLLPYFYSYCLIAFTAYTLELSAITSFLFFFWPASIMLFMFMHQDTLQRNIIALKNITSPKKQNSDWVETLLRICLIAINDNKQLYCVIEHTDSMKEFINTSLPITADLNKGLLELLLESASFDQEKMIWLRADGQLVGINATWDQHNEQDNFDNTVWQHETLLYTSKTNTIAFHCNPVLRNFTIIVGNKILNNVSTHHALQIIKKHINIATINMGSNKQTPKSGIKYEIKNKKHTDEQRTT